MLRSDINKNKCVFRTTQNQHRTDLFDLLKHLQSTWPRIRRPLYKIGTGNQFITTVVRVTSTMI